MAYGFGAYAETMEDSSETGRSREAEAFRRLVAAYGEADAAGPTGPLGAEAERLTRAVWTHLLEDIADPENGLPAEARLTLAKLGLWSMREADDVASGRKGSFAALAEATAALCGDPAPEAAPSPRP